MSDVPVSVSGLTDAVSVTAGNGFACAVRRTGGVECWGDNSTGQLGDGGVESSSPVPVAVLGLSDATLVSSGTGFACARRSPGSVACWGDNTTGQLGDAGGEPMSYTPVSVHGLSDATQVSSGADAACSRRVTGGVACWGANTSGQLGNGTTATSFVPVLVTGLNDAAMVSAGSGFACAVRTGGGGACWGDDRVGQLGDGATHRMSMVPVTISGLAAATTVSAGGFGACAARTASLVCWGYGGSGALWGWLDDQQ